MATAPLRVLLDSRRVVSSDGNNQVKMHVLPQGRGEGYTTFVGSFNVVGNPRTGKGWAEEIARVRGSSHAISCGGIVDQRRDREGCRTLTKT